MTYQPSANKVYQKHDAHSCLKPEHLIKNTTYSISLSPSDKQQYYESTDRVKRFQQQLYGRLLIHLSPYASYDLYVEISEGGRLHCHGTIVIKDVLNFYVYAIPFMRDEMTYEIDTIKDATVWLTYCTKQSHLFENGNPRIKSMKDPLFILEKGKRGSVVTTLHKKTLDEYFDYDN